MAQLGRPTQQNLGRLIAEGRRRAAVKAARKQAETVSRRSNLIRHVDEPPKAPEQAVERFGISTSLRKAGRDLGMALRKASAAYARPMAQLRPRLAMRRPEEPAGKPVKQAMIRRLAVTQSNIKALAPDLVGPLRLAGQFLVRTTVLTVLALAGAVVLTAKAATVTPFRLASWMAKTIGRVTAHAAREIAVLARAVARSTAVLMGRIAQFLAFLRDRSQDVIYYGVRRHLRGALLTAYSLLAVGAVTALAAHLWPIGSGGRAAATSSEPPAVEASAPKAMTRGPKARVKIPPRALVRIPAPREEQAPKVSARLSMMPQDKPKPPQQKTGPDPDRATPAWKAYATRASVPAGQPRIAIIIDDLGMDRDGSRRALELPPAVTLAFLPYAPNLKAVTKAARRRGHELLVHLPMEPDNSRNPGPQALFTGLSENDLKQRISWNLSRFDGFVGINNHMGSRFTRHDTVMGEVMTALKRRGLLFVDSRTTAKTVGARQAARSGVPFLERDVFLDNDQNIDRIMVQLRKVERQARKKGHAVAIGHPYGVTVEALQAWIPTLRDKGLALVPVTALLTEDGRPAGSTLASAAQP